MQHPFAGIGHANQQVHGLTRHYKRGVLPGQVGIDLPVGGKHGKLLSMQVDGMLHNMGSFDVIGYPDLHQLSLFEYPVINIMTVLATVLINQFPADIRCAPVSIAVFRIIPLHQFQVVVDYRRNLLRSRGFSCAMSGMLVMVNVCMIDRRRRRCWLCCGSMSMRAMVYCLSIQSVAHTSKLCYHIVIYT